MELYEQILSRKSVRDFSQEAIAPEKLQIILEAGRLAPSAQNRQCWRYIILQDGENIKNFARHIGLLGTVNFFLAQAPLVIVACADPKRSIKVNGMDYFLVDTAISFQQMMLAAWSMGIGSCWLAAFNEKPVRQFLGIPEQFRVVGISPFGYPKSKQSLYTKAAELFAGSKNRLESAKIFSREKWQF